MTGRWRRPDWRRCLTTVSVTMTPTRGAADEPIKAPLGMGPVEEPKTPRNAISQAGKSAAIPQSQYRSGLECGDRLLSRTIQAPAPHMPRTPATTDQMIMAPPLTDDR